MQILNIKFSQLNELLKSMLTSTIDSPQHKRVLRSRINERNNSLSLNTHRKINSNKDVIKIKKAREIHLELIKSARNINDAYNLHILISISAAFIFIIIMASDVYYFLTIMDYHTELLQSFTFLFWISYCMLNIIIITHNCNGGMFLKNVHCFLLLYICFQISAKYRRKQVLILCHISLHAANTGDILCELYEPSTSKEFRSAIYDFTLQHIQNPLIFRVCGFFDLDYTLIRSMIVTITTYFVIFIQVGDAPSQKVKSYIFKMFKSKEFQRSVMPLIIANSIVCTGLLEYFVNRTIRTIGFVYIICCSVYYSFLFFAVKDIINTFMNIQATDMLGIITKFSFIQNSFLYGLIIFAGFTRKKWIKLFLEQLEVSTQRIDELNVSKNYSFLFWYQCIAGIILIFVISGYIITNIFWFSDCNLSIDYSLILQFYYFETYPSIVMIIIDFTFIFWTRQINFRQLNTVLQSMLTTTIGSPQHKRVLRMKDNWEDDSSLSTIYRTYKTTENLIKLKRIKQIYLELIKCARIINEAYGLQILLSMSSSLINITILLYSLYANILITNISVNWIQEFFAHFYCIFFLIFRIFLICNICETTMTEKYILIFPILLYVANTGDILYELYEPSTSKKFRNEICDIMYQLVQNRLKFTACGFYDIGHTFIYTEFQRSVMPLIITNSIVCTGLLEYFINRTIRRIGFVYTICCILYYTTLFFTLKQIMELFISKQTTEILKITVKFSYVHNVFLYTITILAGLTRRQQIKLFVEQLEICIQEIDKLNVSRNYSSLLRYQCIAGVILIFMILGLIIANIFWFSYYNLSLDYTLILQFYYFETYPAVVATIIDFTFLFWVRQVYKNFIWSIKCCTSKHAGDNYQFSTT
ncbi:gustatory receptor for sugar taste 43a-like [Vespula maculifrons]|uniref:Gustatory receptor for sugar taste 43a-like n=1 Tax=Vespula maculifrons TaxID=7453 RepID=A0ABD2CNV6_VESMC